jgi:GT2 family glycosyltransferase
MTSVDRSGLDLDLVVVDNNSTDDTRQVVASFAGRLPVRCLQEPRPGKNCALNRALRDCALKEIVVFTDDDVTPRTNWLQEIVRSTERWPDVAIFGGQIEVEWPGGREPVWTKIPWILAFGYSRHMLGDQELFYESPQCPFGPNLWMRRSVFAMVDGFDESLGPRPTNRLMGGETALLRSLQARGLKALHVPQAHVRHRIQAGECTVQALRRRAYRFGRGQVRLHGLTRAPEHARSALYWWLLWAADYGYTAARYAWGWIRRDPLRNGVLTIDAMVRFGCLRESRALLRERRRAR